MSIILLNILYDDWFFGFFYNIGVSRFTQEVIMIEKTSVLLIFFFIISGKKMGRAHYYKIFKIFKLHICRHHLRSI